MITICLIDITVEDILPCLRVTENYHTPDMRAPGPKSSYKKEG